VVPLQRAPWRIRVTILPHVVIVAILPPVLAPRYISLFTHVAFEGLPWHILLAAWTPGQAPRSMGIAYLTAVAFEGLPWPIPGRFS